MTDYIVVQRSQAIAAPAATISALIADFHKWVGWSPWEEIDPDLTRTYSGPESGVGTKYEWSGNKKAGAGSMEITAVSDAKIDLDLTFTRPFKSQSLTKFSLASEGDSTVVAWQVLTPKSFMLTILGPFIKLEKNVGGDLEKGLAKLKALAEG